MVLDPMMATVESERHYEVISDGMQVAHLLARFVTRSLKDTFRVKRLPARANRLGQSLETSQWKKNVSFLAQVPLFRNLKKDQLQSLARSVIRRHYAAGEELVSQGKGGVGLFVVASGRAQAVRSCLDGAKVVVNTFGPTDFFGELAVLNNEPRTASVIALEDTECLVLVGWHFLSHLTHCGEMAAVILQEQSRRFQRAISVL